MKRTLGLFLAASAACLSGALFLGASSKVGVEHKEALWAADSFAQLGQAGFVATLIWVGLSLADLRQGPASGPTRLVDVLAYLGLSLMSGFTLLRAVAAGRQNYWDAIHFSTLVWTGMAAALAAAVVTGVAARRGDRPIQVLGWLPAVLTSIWVLVWMATWFGPLGDLIAWLAGSWYLATHG